MRKATYNDVTAAAEARMNAEPTTRDTTPFLTVAQAARIRCAALVGSEQDRDIAVRNMINTGMVHDIPVPKPTYEKPKRPVRVKDLEEGCVLRFVGWEGMPTHERMPTVGKEYTVTEVWPYAFRTIGEYDGSWTGKGWDFVSNPNYAHGLDIRKTYYLKDQDKYSGQYKGKPITISGTAFCERSPKLASYSPSGKYVQGKPITVWPVEDLTTELPKKNYNPEGYPALTSETAQVGAVIRYVGWEDHHGHCPKYGYETTIDRVNRLGAIIYRCEMDEGGVVAGQHWTKYNLAAWVLVKPAVKTYKVRDGEAKDGDTVWWLGQTGPEACVIRDERLVRADDTARSVCTLYNLKAHPWVYQLAEPEYDLVRINAGEAVKAYRYMQAPYNGDSRAYFKALDVPKEDMTDPKNWKVGDILRRTAYGAYAIKAGTEVVYEKRTSSGYTMVDPIKGSNPNGNDYPSMDIAKRFEWVRRP